MKGHHLENEKISWLAFAACTIAYIIVTMTKNTYSTAIAAIVQEGLFSKESSGVINASFYLCYGCTQIFGGYLADRFPPFKILLIGILGTLACNVAMALSTSYTVMLVVWSINGIAQFGTWPAVVKVIASIVMPEHRQKSMFYISFAYAFGAFLSYLIAMVVLKVASWHSLFWTSVVALGFVVIFLLYAMRKISAHMIPDSEAPKQEAETIAQPPVKNISLPTLILSSGLIFLFLPALSRCVMDIGLKGWIPTMMIETYDGISPSFASLLTSILFIVNLAGGVLVKMLHPAHCKNPVTALGIFFLIALPFLGIIILTGKLPLVLIVLSLSLVTTFMASTGQLLNVIVPAAFSKQGKTGTIAGVLNAFGAFGCMVGSYVYGFIAERFGWTATGIFSFILAVITIVVVLIAIPFWKRFSEKNM